MTPKTEEKILRKLERIEKLAEMIVADKKKTNSKSKTNKLKYQIKNQ